jgi:hypothetical protein
MRLVFLEFLNTAYMISICTMTQLCFRSWKIASKPIAAQNWILEPFIVEVLIMWVVYWNCKIFIGEIRYAKWWSKVPPFGREERQSGRSKNYIFPESLICNLICKPVRTSSINKNSREPRLQCRLKFVRTTFTKKAISKVIGLGLDQALRSWKANSKIYKVIFHEVQLILMFTRSKRAIKRSE